MPSEDIPWISDCFRGKDISFPNQTTWCLTELLAEKDVFFGDEDDEDEDNEEDQHLDAEASAVFMAKQTRGSDIGSEAVMSICMQIPMSEKELHPDPKHRAKAATKKPSMYVEMEMTALKRLIEAKCPYTPKLLSVLLTEQDDTMWVPGGLLMFVLMKKLTGRPITAFFKSECLCSDALAGTETEYSFTQSLKVSE